ncbi:hypothetical protein CERSUDRAFT_121125 [Gelatoporia subvermispora B]|uniref:non-specific serine/threonine protein kinase n=1 Tax=Ceriporiopsis subvermispora (strain B) TaxID=914234 RepID=M2RN89_CERS8|nr:hypothetical protein CERSUDRAFT_121125 [Gelatoporia subvermispora B]
MARLSAILPNLVGFVICSGKHRFYLMNILGRGAYGVVYQAHDLSTPKDRPKYYAVKVLLRHPKFSELDQSQKREIAYHRAVSHIPNVVKLHHVIEEEHYVYLVMDFCPGGDLFSAITDRGSFVKDDERVRRMFLQLIDALHGCHDAGIFHRDLKPENIMCSDDDNSLFISDFGLATRTRISSSFGCGSSYYMSPECLGIYASRRPYSTARSDIWALGVILINLLTGRCPWHIASPHEDQGFRKFVQEGVPYLHRMLSISTDTCAILERIFELDPSKRATLNELRVMVKQARTFFGEKHIVYPDSSPTSTCEDEQEVDYRGFEYEDGDDVFAHLSPGSSHHDLHASKTVNDNIDSFVNAHDFYSDGPSDESLDTVALSESDELHPASKRSRSGSSAADSDPPMTPRQHEFGTDLAYDIPDIAVSSAHGEMSRPEMLIVHSEESPSLRTKNLVKSVQHIFTGWTKAFVHS